jgi:hypothetical protein
VTQLVAHRREIASGPSGRERRSKRRFANFTSVDKRAKKSGNLASRGRRFLWLAGDCAWSPEADWLDRLIRVPCLWLTLRDTSKAKGVPDTELFSDFSYLLPCHAFGRRCDFGAMTMHFDDRALSK